MKATATLQILPLLLIPIFFTGAVRAEVPEVKYALDSGGIDQSPPPAHGRFQFIEGLFFLDLSDEQQSLVETILNESKSEWESLMEEELSARIVLDDAVNRDEFSEDDVRDAAKNEAEVREELMVFKGGIVSKIRALLTEEQKTILDGLRTFHLKGRENPSFD